MLSNIGIVLSQRDTSSRLQVLSHSMSAAVATAAQPAPMATGIKADEQKNINVYDVTNASQWKKYTKNRSRYPGELLDRVYAFHEANCGSFNSAHDAGCGPGMTATAIARKFGRIICSDFSHQAVDAPKDMLTVIPVCGRVRATNPHFIFRHSAAEDMVSWIDPNSGHGSDV